ncbi:MAG: hypothetical protein ACR2ND_01885, partial [Solirubrobacteraceae bacterium]
MQALKTRDSWPKVRCNHVHRPVTFAVSAALAVLVGLPGMAAAAGPGSLDSSFGSGGVASLGTGSQLFGVAVQSNGEVVAAGQSGGRVLVKRFTTAGKPDKTFTGPAGYARAVAIQLDGKIVIAGATGGAMLVERLTSSLSPDSSFGSGGTATALAGSSAVANGVAVGPDGSIVIAGAQPSLSTMSTPVGVARFSSSGKLEWSKGLNFGSQSAATAVAIQPADGKIVLVGRQTPLQVTNAVVARLNTDGSLDSSFAGNGALTYHYPGGGYTALTSVALQRNGQIVAGGVALAATSNALFLRLNSNGSFDTGFGSGGVGALPSGVDVSVLGDPIGAYGVGIAGGGRIVGAGNFENTGVEVDAALWALTPGGAAQSGFGNGGTVRGPSGASEECALAVAPDGSLVAVGNTVKSFPDRSPCDAKSASAAGFVARYIGFGQSTSALKVTLKRVSGSDKTSTVAKHGLKVRVSCNEACTIKLSLGVSSGTARRLHILTTFKKCTKVRGKKHCVRTRG